jgi:hypothetical protein
MNPRDSQPSRNPASAKAFQAFCNAIVGFFRPRPTQPAFDAETEARCRRERAAQEAYAPKVEIAQHEAVVYRWRSTEGK